MRILKSPRSRVIGVVSGLFVALVHFAAIAQVPSQDQIEIFRNLPQEQQQAILEQMGTQSGATDRGAGSRSSTGAASREGQSTDSQRRRPQRQDEQEPRIPVLKKEDTLLVQIALPDRRLVTAAPAQTAQNESPLNSQNRPLIPSESGPQTNSAGPNRQYLEPIELEAQERRKLEALVDLVRSRNPYVLDSNGQLNLPGFPPMALGGLTEEQASQRLSAEPTFLKLDVKIVRLPLIRTGVQALKRFGYDLFDDSPSTFSPVTDVPVPADYVVGPGDELNIQLYGNQNRNLLARVSREGTISLPNLGPMRIAGLTFNAAKRDIEARIQRELIGVSANVSMGDVRSIRVFVLGEAKQPGSYTVSGLATVTSALFASGGVKPIGSLRDIQLKRHGEIVRRFDLYDLLINGDTSDDAKLLQGDVIFIPPVGPTVSVDGEVKRPAIYELRGESTLSGVVQIAGGLTPEADARRGSLTQIDAAGRRMVLEVNLRDGDGRARKVGNGDVLRVARLRPQIDSGVLLEGFVHRPGPVAWHQGMRLTDVIGSTDELKPNADQRYILIRRESGVDRRVSVISGDLIAALENPGSDADVELSPRDRITVFDLQPGREQIIKPLLEELRLQSGLTRPTEVVRVEGRIKVPGEYPLETGMRISDLVRAGGDLDTAAYGGTAELARYTVGTNGSRQTELIQIDLAAVRRGDVNANIALQPFDYLLVKETPDWGDQESVTLRGEIRFPGTYPIRRGETLRQLLDRAGGLTSMAFPKGTAFTRRDLKEREQRQLDQLTDRLQTDLAALSLQAAAANQAGASQALMAGQSLLTQLRGSKAVGRLVIDLPGLLVAEAGSGKDIVLRDGDELIVPKQRQEVTVIGEVQSATSHLYARSLTRDDYISLSGGLTRKGDRGHIYVVHADGSVVAEQRSWFRRSHDIAIEPGDTIVVPLDAERMPKLPFWQAVTQIIYYLAVSVAAINSF